MTSQPPSSTLPELRMVELVPVDVALAVELLVVPAEELEVVLGRVLLHPLDEAVVLDARLALGAPELGRPREDAEVVVEPVVPAALDRRLRVVAEVVEDRDRRVPGALRGLVAQQLVTRAGRRSESDRRRSSRTGADGRPRTCGRRSGPVMFGRAATASPYARVSGSEKGNGPAPGCSPSGAHSTGKLRFRSSPSSGGAILIWTPS